MGNFESFHGKNVGSGGVDTTWKFLDSKTGTTAINLPADFNELLIYVYSRGNSSEIYTFSIASPILSSTAKTFRTGSYVSSTNNAATAISVSNSSVNLDVAAYNGTNYASTSIIYVYYR